MPAPFHTSQRQETSERRIASDLGSNTRQLADREGSLRISVASGSVAKPLSWNWESRWKDITEQSNGAVMKARIERSHRPKRAPSAIESHRHKKAGNPKVARAKSPIL